MMEKLCRRDLESYDFVSTGIKSHKIETFVHPI